MHRFRRSCFAVLSALSLAFGGQVPARAAPAAGAVITVDTGNNSNIPDNELSLFEALNTVTLAKNACFTTHEKNQISGASWYVDPYTCGQGVGETRWNINPVSDLFPATIQFTSAVTDVTVDGALPAVTTMTTIDGQTSAGKVRLLKSGSYTGPGLLISGCGSCSHDVYIRNLKIQGFSGDGITNVTNGLTDSAFTGLEITWNTGNGIRLSYGSSKNPRTILIGGASLSERNWIYQNGGTGIFIQGSAAIDQSDFNILIQGSVVGMSPASMGQANGAGGIWLNNARGVTIGGDSTAAGNTVVSNIGDGIKISGAGSFNDVVKNNFIGAESGGGLDRGNSGCGVSLLNGAHLNSVTLNLISANDGQAGVLISGSGSSNNTISSNMIGLGVDSSLGNTGSGVLISALAASNLLSANEIGWNKANGVYISGGASNQLTGNSIGGKGALALGNSGAGVLLDGGAAYNAVGAVGAGNWIGSNGSDGVSLQGTGTTANTVAANVIGRSSTGDVRPNHHDVSLQSGASANTIGGSGAGNTIVSNSGAGIVLTGTGTSGNFIYSNDIGTNSSGSAGLGNASAGVTLASGADSNTIGGAGSLGNVIASNGGPGIDISTSSNTAAGNTIGMNPAGTYALGNGASGVRLSGGTANNTVGLNNLISGNYENGVQIDSGSSSNSVLGNTIGLNAAGSAKIPNQGSGVLVMNNSKNNRVGASGQGNIISGNNGFAGIYITDAGTDGTTVYGNIIGTNGASASGLGNVGSGVMVTNGAQVTRIGNGGLANARNYIAGNLGSGVAISGGATNTVNVEGNYIGVNLAGTQALANHLAGITMVSAAYVTIGSDKNAALQCISGNLRQGIYVQGVAHLEILGAALSNQVIGNQCSLNYAGVGNGMEGILLDGSQSSYVTPRPTWWPTTAARGLP